MPEQVNYLHDAAYWRALLLSWMPEQVDYLHDAAYWRALLSWMPEQVDYLHDAAYWRALLGRCQGAEVLQVREMESHEGSGPTGCGRTTNTPSATARSWRPEVFELHRHYLNFIAMVLRKK